MIKIQIQVIWYSEFHLNVCYNLQPVHNELTLFEWNSIFSRSQCKVFWSHTSLRVSPKNTLYNDQIGLTEKQNQSH